MRSGLTPQPQVHPSPAQNPCRRTAAQVGDGGARENAGQVVELAQDHGGGYVQDQHAQKRKRQSVKRQADSVEHCGDVELKSIAPHRYRDDPQIERRHGGDARVIIEEGGDRRCGDRQHDRHGDAVEHAETEDDVDQFPDPVDQTAAPVLPGDRTDHGRHRKQDDQGKCLDPGGDTKPGNRGIAVGGDKRGDHRDGGGCHRVGGGCRQGDVHHPAPGPCQHRDRSDPPSQQPLPPMQNRQTGDQRSEIGDHAGDRRALDFKPGRAEQPEDQDRIEHHVDPGRGHHHVARELGIAGRPQYAIADHRDDDETHAEVPDFHIVPDQR